MVVVIDTTLPSASGDGEVAGARLVTARRRDAQARARRSARRFSRYPCEQRLAPAPARNRHRPVASRGRHRPALPASASRCSAPRSAAGAAKPSFSESRQDLQQRDAADARRRHRADADTPVGAHSALALEALVPGQIARASSRPPRASAARTIGSAIRPGSMAAPPRASLQQCLCVCAIDDARRRGIPVIELPRPPVFAHSRSRSSTPAGAAKPKPAFGDADRRLEQLAQASLAVPAWRELEHAQHDPARRPSGRSPRRPRNSMRLFRPQKRSGRAAAGAVSRPS
jgi:hypothetical protein